MRYLSVVLVLFLIPSVSFADKHEDINSGIREILIALSQVSVQGKDASTFAQIQGALTKISKDISDLGDQYKSLKEQADKCKAEETKKVQERK